MRAKGLKALKLVASGPDRPFEDRRKRKITYRSIQLTKRQARRFYHRLVELEAEAALYAEMAHVDRRMSATRELELAELRRRLIVAGIDPSDRWPR